VSPALRTRRRPGRGSASAEQATRTARAVAAGSERLWPWWLERQLDVSSPAFVALPGLTGALPSVTGRSWTVLGARSGTDLAAVDPRGLVTPRAGGWSLDWWVGADDRWHLPSREVAVRQRLIGGAPVVETAMRVPGGDVVATAWVAQASSADGGAEVVVVEIANDTAVPVALALAVRPYDGEGVTSVRTVALRDGDRVEVDGRPALRLPRPPARAVLSPFADGDPVAAVVAGQAAPPHPGAAVRCPDGLASGAFVLPLTHRTSVRVVVALEPGGVLPAPASLPPADAVARGWRTHAEAGARLVLPEDGLSAAVAASRCSVLLAPRTGPRGDDLLAVAGALDELSHHPEARALVEEAIGRPVRDVDAATLEALDRHLALHQDGAFAGRAAPTVAAAAEVLARKGGGDGLPAAARVLEQAGESAAAAAAREAAARLPIRPSPPPLDGSPALSGRSVQTPGLSPVATLRQAAVEVEAGDERALERLGWALEVASATAAWPAAVHPRLGTGCAGTGHSVVAAAALLRLVRRLLVVEEPGGLVLLPVLPGGWRGQGLEVHDLPTTGGALSFAVRWHGSRPALLWELGGDGAVGLRAPGLDPSWSSAERRGDALLAGTGADVQGGSFA
jgi:hypothetical protein